MKLRAWLNQHFRKSDDVPPMTWPRVLFIVIAAHIIWFFAAANLSFFAEWAGLEKWLLSH